jgi:hypothetical protein
VGPACHDYLSGQEDKLYHTGAYTVAIVYVVVESIAKMSYPCYDCHLLSAWDANMSEVLVPILCVRDWLQGLCSRSRVCPLSRAQQSC